MQHLDHEVGMHCSSQVISEGFTIDALAKKIRALGEEGVGTIGYCYTRGKISPNEFPPGDMFKCPFALERTSEGEYAKRNPLKRTNKELARLFIMADMWRDMGDTLDLRTMSDLKQQLDRNSTQALCNPDLVNRVLSHMQLNPRKPVPACIIDGVISWGRRRLGQDKSAFEESSSSQPAASKKHELAVAIQKLKDHRQDKEEKTDTSSLMVPLLLIGAAFFLLSS